MCENENEPNDEEARLAHQAAVSELARSLQESSLDLDRAVMEFFGIACLWCERYDPSFDDEYSVSLEEQSPPPIRDRDEREASLARLKVLSESLMLLIESNSNLGDPSSIGKMYESCRRIHWERVSDNEEASNIVSEARGATSYYLQSIPLLQQLQRHLAFRASEEENNPRESNPSVTQERTRTATAEELMAAEFIRNRNDMIGWTAVQCARKIGKSVSSVKATETWATIIRLRESQKLERMQRDAERADRMD